MKHLVVYQIKYKKVIISTFLTFIILPQQMSKQGRVYTSWTILTFYKSICSCCGVSSLKNSDNETYRLKRPVIQFLKLFDLLLALHGLQSLHFFSTVILNRTLNCGVFVNQSLRFLKRHLNQDKNVSFLVLIIKIDWLHSTVTYWFGTSTQASIADQLEGTP